MTPAGTRPAVAQLREVSHRYGKVVALDEVSVEVPAGRLVGLIGPDGVGKSSLLALVAGARKIQSGTVTVLGGDMKRSAHRREVCPRIAYMPQGLGRNLYPTLSVAENLDFFGSLFGQNGAERRARTKDLTRSTGLEPFLDRPAGKLSGGMKQKLALCCALIHDPDLLILDEPTTGIDPLSRRQFWDLIDGIRAQRPAMSVIVATAYMEEAARFDWLFAMNAGRVLAAGTPQDLLLATQANTLEAAFIALLPEEATSSTDGQRLPPRRDLDSDGIAIEAQSLTKRFGDFVAVDHVSFRIRRGEIFGFLGSNGCGKTTTMKMLTGLLPASEGTALLFGRPVDPYDIESRMRVGYMSQSFSLYPELTVRQNLELHAKLFRLPAAEIPHRVAEIADRFGLSERMGALPMTLPLGLRQRLSLAVAMIHKPEILVLDEPTSGVDPLARDAFWEIMLELSRRDGVTIFVSTHFMNEAERCDRISLMHAGRVLVSDAPDALVRNRKAASLEDAFISYLTEAAAAAPAPPSAPEYRATTPAAAAAERGFFDPRRVLSYTRRESLELRRDPIRATLALLGSVILMFVMAYGMSMDVENLTFAVLDRDQTTTSRDYALNLSGSRYFLEQPPITDYADLDRRMRSGEISLAIEIPPGFAKDVKRDTPVEIGVWIDGAMPMRAETIRGYVQGIHSQWLSSLSPAAAPATIEIRYRYNPDLESIVSMAPAMIPILLLLIPAMLSALSVVREKELGSIINLYVTPVTRFEFLLGKQLPYLALAILNFVVLSVLAMTALGVPFKGSYAALFTAACLYAGSTTAIGFLFSSVMSSQIAAVFGTAIVTLIPATQFSGIIDPVSSLQGAGYVIGQIYPTAHFLTISRGTFSKALGFADLGASFWPLLVAYPVLMALSVSLLRKQEA